MTMMVVIAAMLALVVLTQFGDAPRCVMCGGKNAHRDGCPNDR